MSSYLRYLKVLSLFLLSFLLFACASRLSSRPVPAVTKAVVLNITADFLNYVVAGSALRLNNVVNWSDYLDINKPGLTQEDFLSQLQIASTHWKANESPLLDLDLLEITIEDDIAELTLQRIGKPDFPKIWVKLYWNGAGWKVIDDSLFGMEEQHLLRQVQEAAA